MKKQLPLYYKEMLPHIADTLDNIFISAKPADKAIEQIMRLNKKWPFERRNFFAEAIYDFVRYRRLLQETAETYFNTSNISYHEIIICWLVYKGYDIPTTGIYKSISPTKINTILQKLSAVRKLRESIPDWLDAIGEKETGKKWNEIIASLNQKPPLTIRANFLKITVDGLRDELKKENISTIPVDWCPGALIIPVFTNLFRTEAFKKGLFELQDAASQMVVNSMNIKPGMRIIDACAGAGGKSLHIASLMNNKGKIIALDNKEWKLTELKTRARRAGIDIIETKVLDSTKILKRLANTADKVLLDVPCSGTGVLKRNPDIKWKLTPERLLELQKLQQHILLSYSQLTKPGGEMVYATCSVLPSEGEEQIKTFLQEKNIEWDLVDEKRISPAEFNCDGFYIALLKKK